MYANSITNYSAVRAKTIIPLTGEGVARGIDALTRSPARIDDGVILARNGIILDVESYKDYTRRPNAPTAAYDLGDVILVPGLVNCHTHLEISHMAGKTVCGKGFADWVASLIALDAKTPDSAEDALHKAVASLISYGTAGLGDISSRMPRAVLSATQSSGIDSRIFCEIIGHGETAVAGSVATAKADTSFSLAGHAFYTTSEEAMVRAKQWCTAQLRPFSLHLAEHPDEVQCLRDASGKLYDQLRIRILPPSWRAPKMSPVQYAASLGLLTSGTVAVHCVQCDKTDIATLATGSAAVCLCPRSNACIAVGEAPAAEFAARGILLCLGTDSLASNTDLDVWKEAEYFLGKSILPANALLRMATVNGAAVLGLHDQVGRLEKGMRFCYKTFPNEMNAFFR